MGQTIDIVRIAAQCSKELGGNKDQDTMKECFCEKLVNELKQMEVKDLANCFISARLIVEAEKTLVMFLF